jgi:hypothetical protein
VPHRPLPQPNWLVQANQRVADTAKITNHKLDDIHTLVNPT